MPSLQTKYHGVMEYKETSVLCFPNGLFGFEEESGFAPIALPALQPIIFLQSLKTPDLCFVAFPVLVVDRNYRLDLDDHDLRTLGFPVSRQPRIGADVLCLALITIQDAAPTSANLLAPLVVNLQTRQGVQAINRDLSYSHQYPFLDRAEELVCS